MPLFKQEEWSFAEKAADLVTTNPFDRSWTQKERGILGEAGSDASEVYSWRPGLGLWGPQTSLPDVVEVSDQIDELVNRLQKLLRDGASATELELERYEILALYQLYGRYGEELDRYIDANIKGRGRQGGGSAARGDEIAFVDLKNVWGDFRRAHAALFHIAGRDFPMNLSAEHIFACFFLLRRAFCHIFLNIVGASKPVAELRSAVWQSIVTHDLLGWCRSLYRRMNEFPTLITGPSGTGKELVAQAVGRSQYIPFDPSRGVFKADFLTAFQSVNLSALPPQLIESELFGHVKGAFTSAVRDRKGRLEECPEYGAVFLDEIGDLTPEIQVKLLRVLQTGRFQRVGENEDRKFVGKIIAATNRDLAAEMQTRRFREDFYFRLCADRIATPSLREQLADCPEDLSVMVEFICRRVVGEEKAAAFSREVVAWMGKNPRLGVGYAWPGNFRELEQCVRSYTIRKDYRPIQTAGPPGDSVRKACETLTEAMVDRDLQYAELERRLFTLVYERTGSYQEAGKILQRDWRTVQARVAAADTVSEKIGQRPAGPMRAAGAEAKTADLPPSSTSRATAPENV